MSSGHSIELAGGWSMWRTVWLRSAGFAVSDVLSLAAPNSTSALDRLRRAESLRAEAVARATSTFEQARQQSVRGQGKLLNAVLKKIAEQAPFEISDELPDDVRTALKEIAALDENTRAIRTAYRETFALEHAQIGEHLRSVAKDARFREAVLWQNRKALHGTIDALLRKPAGKTDSKTLEHERLVASYLQRYCTKNETIGFFGPVAWASLTDHADAIALAPGEELLRRRTVYFERWAIEALADALARDPELEPHVAPRLLPTVRIDPSLPPEVIGVLRASSGERSARDIARALASDSALRFFDEEEVIDLIRELVEKQVLRWTFEIPVWDPKPELALREQLARIADETARARAIARLDELEAARHQVALAAGDPQRLDEAIAALEQIFAAQTGQNEQRREGQAYAGRTIFFEDTVRDVSCTFGAAVLERIARPLQLLLLSARWYTHEVARRLTRIFRDCAVGEELDYRAFWSEIEPYVYGPIYEEVIAELQQKWSKILALDPAQHHIERSSAELEAAVAAEFHAPSPGWPMARFHAPDLMIAARDAQAINAGDFFVVLGELHASVNSLFSQVAVAQHPSAGTLFESAAIDIAETLLLPIEAREHATRADYVPYKLHDPLLAASDSCTSRPRNLVIPISELVVRRVGEQLVVATRDGRVKLDMMAALGQYLSFGAISKMTVVPSLEHTPRVSIDHLVLSREKWTYRALDLGFALRETPEERFEQARRWIVERGLPRFAFVKVSQELKPFYVDFESPVLVEILARRIRKAEWVSISEMLPSPEQCWLIDQEGRSYTSELRMVAVDPAPWASK